MRVIEKFYTVPETASLLGVCHRTVKNRLKAREFGTDVVNIGTTEQPDYRIPASAINAWLSARRVFPEPGIAARTVGELRRKAAQAEAEA
jgi:hypothetical protein